MTITEEWDAEFGGLETIACPNRGQGGERIEVEMNSIPRKISV
ncbi:hypothetical protein ACN4EK_28435 [Pantanalinema rosaneae CENA516]